MAGNLGSEEPLLADDHEGRRSASPTEAIDAGILDSPEIVPGEFQFSSQGLALSFIALEEEQKQSNRSLNAREGGLGDRPEFERLLQDVYTDLETGSTLTTPEEREDILQKLKTEAARVNTYLPIQKAAVYINDALIGHSFPFEDEKIRVYQFYRSKRVMSILDFTCILMCFLALLQVHTNADAGDATAKRSEMATWVDPLIILAELWCMVIFVGQSVLQYNFMDRKTFVTHPICVVLAVCNFIYIFDLVVMPLIYGGDTPLFSIDFDDADRPHLKFYVRPIFAVMHFSKVRDTLPSIAKTVRALIPVICFIAVFLVTFAVLGFMLFYDRNSYFSSVPWALYQLHVGLTTANYPDIMINGYSLPVHVNYTQTTHIDDAGNDVVVNQYVFEDNPASHDASWVNFTRIISPIYFMFFYLVGFYFLLSVAFAVVFDEYKGQLQASVLKMHHFRRKNLALAYYQLTSYVNFGYDEFNRRLNPQRTPSSPRTADTYAIRDNQLEYLDVEGRAKRVLDLLESFAKMRAQAKEGQRLQTQHMDSGKKLGSKRKSMGTAQGQSPGGSNGAAINLYIFTLIYDALFPEARAEDAARDSKGVIKVGSRVGLLRDLDINGGLLRRGTTGFVINTPGYHSQYYEVTFRVNPRDAGTLYTHLATEDEMFLIESPKSNARMARVYFHAMDVDESGEITQREFMAFYHALQLKVKVVHDERLWLERVMSTKIFQSSFVQGFINIFGAASPWPNRALDVIVAGGLVLMVCHFQMLAEMERKHGERRYDDSWYRFMFAEVAVNAILDLITVLRLLAMGWSVFFAKKWNKFAFLVLTVDLLFYVAILVLSVFFGKQALPMVYNFAGPDDVVKDPSMPDLFLLILFFRLICGIRILAEFQVCRHILKTFMNILPVFRAYIFATMVVYFYYACLGMVLLSSAKVPRTTSYATDNYYALNFESFYNSIVTLWCIMIVNNWFVIVDGYRAACGDWVIVYFVSFWVFCVLLVMNVVTAVTVELWGQQWELNRRAAVNIKNNPFAKRILQLNQLTPDCGDDFYLLGLPVDPDGSKPYYKVGYRKYSHKAELALERMFVKDEFHKNPAQWKKKEQGSGPRRRATRNSLSGAPLGEASPPTSPDFVTQRTQDSCSAQEDECYSPMSPNKYNSEYAF